MGKGDRRTRRGKIVAGTHGNTRPKKRVKKVEKTESQEQAKA
mgnify:CR=1 FL=1